MKILLTMPHPHAKYGLFSRFTYPSLTLKQLAAITPPEHDITIIDERFDYINFDIPYDVVGISTLTYNSIRGYEIAREFRKRNITTVIGGYHATLLPDEAQQNADSVVVGEGEYVWPQVLKDIENGWNHARSITSKGVVTGSHGPFNPFSLYRSYPGVDLR